MSLEVTEEHSEGLMKITIQNIDGDNLRVDLSEYRSLPDNEAVEAVLRDFRALLGRAMELVGEKVTAEDVTSFFEGKATERVKKSFGLTIFSGEQPTRFQLIALDE